MFDAVRNQSTSKLEDIKDMKLKKEHLIEKCKSNLHIKHERPRLTTFPNTETEG